jgi:hypothetical protein
MYDPEKQARALCQLHIKRQPNRISISQTHGDVENLSGTNNNTTHI